MTNIEVLKFTLQHLVAERDRINAGLKLVSQQLDMAEAQDRGQPACGIHGTKYQDDTCNMCAQINGVGPIKVERRGRPKGVKNKSKDTANSTNTTNTTTVAPHDELETNTT